MEVYERATSYRSSLVWDLFYLRFMIQSTVRRITLGDQLKERQQSLLLSTVPGQHKEFSHRAMA